MIQWQSPKPNSCFQKTWPGAKSSTSQDSLLRTLHSPKPRKCLPCIHGNAIHLLSLSLSLCIFFFKRWGFLGIIIRRISWAGLCILRCWRIWTLISFWRWRLWIDLYVYFSLHFFFGVEHSHVFRIPMILFPNPLSIPNKPIRSITIKSPPKKETTHNQIGL